MQTSTNIQTQSADTIGYCTSLARSLKENKTNHAARKISMAQALRRNFVKYLTSTLFLDDSKITDYCKKFSALTGQEFSTWEQTLDYAPDLPVTSRKIDIKQRDNSDLCPPAKTLSDLCADLDFDGYTAIVHGSLSDGKYTHYSDVDISVFIEKDALTDTKKRSTLLHEITTINQAIERIDPVGHHGCFINLVQDLDCYPEAHMPLDVLNGGFSLNGKAFSRDIMVRDSLDYAFLTLIDLCGFFINLPQQNMPTDAATIKNIISRFFIINLLHYELFHQEFTEKRAILIGGLQDIATPTQQDTLDMLTEIRDIWPETTENKAYAISRPLIQHCADTAADILDHLVENGKIAAIESAWT